MHRFFALSSYTRQKYGKRVQKIPLDAGFSCPNRDGTISMAGCIYCNPEGSGSGMLERGLSLPKQWAFWRDLHEKRHKIDRFTAYLQSYSNTHGPIEKLAHTLSELKGLPGLTSLSLGTRPDCLDNDRLDLLAEQLDVLGLDEITLELGLQSSNDETLARINRGHDSETFADAVHRAAQRGLSVCAHIMAGLPKSAPTPTDNREGLEELLTTVRFVNDLPVAGAKFHNTYVCKGTPLAKLWNEKRYTSLALDEYLHWLSEALMHLSPTTVIHRLNGNPLEGELLSPEWAGNMRSLHNTIRAHFETHDVWQGKKNGAESGPPAWFSPDYRKNAS